MPVLAKCFAEGDLLPNSVIVCSVDLGRPSVQAKDANGLQKALANSIGNYQVVEGDAGPGQLQNVVEVAPFLKVRAIAGCQADSKAPARDKTLVNITEARVELFGIRRAPPDTHPGEVQHQLPDSCPPTAACPAGFCCESLGFVLMICYFVKLVLATSPGLAMLS